MPLYTFRVSDGATHLFDEDGVSMPDRRRALQYAEQVARELMVHREKRMRHWRLDLYEDDRRVFELPFSRVDPAIENLPANFRETVETAYERQRALKAVIERSRRLVLETRALVARSRGQVYLAAADGEPVIGAADGSGNERHAG